MDLEPGTVVANRYRVTRPLGRGGMGEVFAAENIRTGRPVAVKLLRSESKSKSSAVARFRREARAAGSINSDHVTEILDVEEDEEHGICLVFELLEGESLIERLKRTGPIPYDELHAIIEQTWRGLADAHKAGIIHRDLKPSNVFLEKRPDGSNRVKILDFGISKLPKEMGGETLTEMGQSLGTFSFMPPEQIGKAKTVDHRADIYACATLIFQALTGQLPYAARNILVMVEMKSKQEPRKLSQVMKDPVDPRLEAFLANALARDPDKRYQTADESLAAWQELAPQNNPPSAPAPQRRTGLGGTQIVASPLSHHHLISDSTSDTAATIAIPVRQLFDQSQPHLSGRGQPQQVSSRTIPVTPSESRNPGYPPSPSPEQARQNEPFGNTVAMRQDGSPYQSGSHQRPDSEPPDPNGGPNSEGMTQVYRPSVVAEDSLVARPAPPAPAQRGAITFVLGAIAFALVGFGLVAIVLEYMRTGTFPWQ